MDINAAESVDFDKLYKRIEALRAKTTLNGCTQAEAMAAAGKVAELLDRYELSLTDLQIRASPCVKGAYDTLYKNRVPVDDCMAAIAHFCDCEVWHDRDEFGFGRIVYFGLRADTEVALYLTELIDAAVFNERGRFKCSPEYQKIPHKERALASRSFAMGMVHSIGEKLKAMKIARDAARHTSGRDLMVLKASVVEAEFARLNMQFQTVYRQERNVSPSAFEAGGVVGAALAINPGIRAD